MSNEKYVVNVALNVKKNYNKFNYNTIKTQANLSCFLLKLCIYVTSVLYKSPFLK